MMTVWCTTEFESFHYWPMPPPEHEFLGEPHRHIFKVKLEIEVSRSNRQIEFIKLKRELTAYCINRLQQDYRTSSTLSCEQMCESILGWCNEEQHAPVSITVSEDGENGATWYRD